MYCISGTPGDSVYVSAIDLANPKGKENEKYISSISRLNGALDHIIEAKEMLDITGDSVPEFIIQISAGFTLQPRSVFAWDMVKDTVLQSPYSGTNIEQVLIDPLLRFFSSRLRPRSRFLLSLLARLAL